MGSRAGVGLDKCPYTAHNRCLDTFTRRYLLVLIETIVTALTGTLLGPVIGGDFGYAWGYWSGWIGPIACVLLAGSLLPLARMNHFIGPVSVR